MPTKAQLEAKLAKIEAEANQLKQENEELSEGNVELQEQLKTVDEQIAEAKRQSTHIPVSKGSENEGGSYAIDHLEVLDNHEAPDTNRYTREEIDERDNADLSFWNNSWTWVHTENSYGDKPQDSWFVNPTSKLIGEVMSNAPTVFGACEVALVAGSHTEQLEKERQRHIEFLRETQGNDLISESLDLMTSYQSRYFEAVQRWIGLNNSYENQKNMAKPDKDRLQQAKIRKEEAGANCRAWAARLIALREAYHECVSDDRAYNLNFNFAPLPPESGKPPSREYSLYRWAVTQTLNKIGRRLARNIKDGKLDANQYNIPRPWLEEDSTNKQLDTDALISDFD